MHSQSLLVQHEYILAVLLACKLHHIFDPHAGALPARLCNAPDNPEILFQLLQGRG